MSTILIGTIRHSARNGNLKRAPGGSERIIRLKYYNKYTAKAKKRCPNGLTITIIPILYTYLRVENLDHTACSRISTSTFEIIAVLTIKRRFDRLRLVFLRVRFCQRITFSFFSFFFVSVRTRVAVVFLIAATLETAGGIVLQMFRKRAYLY